MAQILLAILALPLHIHRRLRLIAPTQVSVRRPLVGHATAPRADPIERHLKIIGLRDPINQPTTQLCLRRRAGGLPVMLRRSIFAGRVELGVGVGDGLPHDVQGGHGDRALKFGDGEGGAGKAGATLHALDQIPDLLEIFRPLLQGPALLLRIRSCYLNLLKSGLQRLHLRPHLHQLVLGLPDGLDPLGLLLVHRGEGRLELRVDRILAAVILAGSSVGFQ
mmetsp:Transcript_3739/g.8276  ORF Transcript_3739/g.8276 Transcript_3739/m.8276 type:complete len:221 (+) Transcript_3739:678-1340(+)